MEIETFSQNSKFVVLEIRKPQPKCKYPECNFYAMKLIGECNSCNKNYCRIHRIPETHKCKNLVEIKEKLRKKLELKLLSEKTQEMKKIINI